MNRNVIRLLLMGLFALFNGSVYAATQPKFTLTPTTPTSFNVAANGAASVQYLVTNQTNDTRVLTMVPIAGITQATTGEGNCANPFTLKPHQSCLLTLSLVGSQLSKNIVGGPEVCATNGPYDNSPDPYLCSQASQANSLNITRTPAEQPTLTVTPDKLTLFIDGSVGGELVVRNHSTSVTATNISARFNSANLLSSVTQDATLCSSVAPGGECRLMFALKQTAHAFPFATFPIQGSNTLSVNAAIRVVGLSISVNKQRLTLNPDGTPGIITVTNLSNTTAKNITAKLIHTALSGNVTQDATDCLTVLSGASCDLSFSSSTGAPVTLTVVPINGSNTAAKGVGINVTSSTVAVITTNSPLVFEAPAVGELIVTNTTEFTATNIAANLTGTALDAQLDQDATNCLELVGGATCTLTFTAKTGAVAATAFVPVTGTNASTTEAEITLNVPDQIQLSITSDSSIQLLPDGITTGFMTIKNNSTQPAYAINAIFSNTALSGQVTATECELIAAGGECTMTFTPGTTIVAPTEFNIVGIDQYGAPTQTVQGTISIGSYYAYITDTATATLSKCLMNPDSGALSDCSIATSDLTFPEGVVVDRAGKYIYIADYFQARIDRYTIDPLTGNLSGLASTYFNDNDGFAAGLALNPDGTKLYLTRGTDSNYITVCTVESDGDLICGIATTSLVTSIGIAIDPNNEFAFVTGTDGDGIGRAYRFTINGDGTLTNKTVVFSSGSEQGLLDIAINALGSPAYLTNWLGTTPDIFKCTIDISGNFSCVNSATTGSGGGQTGIALNAAGTFAYVLGGLNASDTPYQVAQCSINATQDISSCFNAGAQSFINPYGIALWEGLN